MSSEENDTLTAAIKVVFAPIDEKSSLLHPPSP